MTTAGVTVYNDSGAVQIDESYCNYVLRKAGQIACSTTVLNCKYGAFQVTAKEPIVAIVGSSVPVFAITSRNNADPTKWDIVIYAQGTSGPTVQYYVFDRADEVGSSGTFGLQIFDAAGALRFSSEQLPCRISSIIQTADYVADGILSATTAVGSNRAVICATHASFESFVLFSHPFPSSYFYTIRTYIIGCKISGGNATYGQIKQYDGENVGYSIPGLDHTTHFKALQFLFVDVSNLPTTL